FDSTDSILWRRYSKNFAKELERPLFVSIEVCEYFPNVEMAIRRESSCIEKYIPRDWNAENGAADIDVRKIKRFAVEGHETLRPDLSDIGPEIRKQLAFFGLAIHSRSIQFHPVKTNADNAASARIQSETIKSFLPFFVRARVQQNLPGAARYTFRI